MNLVCPRQLNPVGIVAAKGTPEPGSSEAGGTGAVDNTGACATGSLTFCAFVDIKNISMAHAYLRDTISTITYAMAMYHSQCNTRHGCMSYCCGGGCHRLRRPRLVPTSGLRCGCSPTMTRTPPLAHVLHAEAKNRSGLMVIVR